MSCRNAAVNQAEATQLLLDVLDQSWDDSDLDCNKELANENETDDVPTIQKLEELEVDNLM